MASLRIGFPKLVVEIFQESDTTRFVATWFRDANDPGQDFTDRYTFESVISEFGKQGWEFLEKGHRGDGK